MPEVGVGPRQTDTDATTPWMNDVKDPTTSLARPACAGTNGREHRADPPENKVLVG